ncbi:UNVERIFIED_CONTAM: hypothetical protein Slati_4124600 [Sesamum latifolium]|uniref:RNase H type-1 domain-containing protein n=1 Tax=Sesamum latifolium TaxID=2727402 RepID=A0AAW2T8Y3_9LAMI
MHSPSSSSNLGNGIPNSEDWKFVWNRAVPRKTMIFCWKVCHNALPTLSNLAKRRVTSVTFVRCAVRKMKHSAMYSSNAILPGKFGRCHTFLIKSSQLPIKTVQTGLKIVAIIHLSEFTNCQESLTVTQHRTRISQCYPPPTDTIKVNFDGANYRELSSTGIGVVARNSEGVLLAWRRKHLSFPTEPDHAEILAAKEAVEFAREKGWRSVIIEGDCLSIINKLKDVEDDYSPLGPISEHVKALAVAFQSLTYVHVHRQANTLCPSIGKVCSF